MRRQSDRSFSQTLNLLPYLLAKGEVRLSKAAADLRLTGSEVKQLVRLLQFCGLPPYGGADTFDCYVERGSVRLLAARGAPLRPARLTSEEALALAVGTHLAGQLVPSVSNAAGRLREKVALAAATQELDVPLQVEREPQALARWLSFFRSAIANRSVAEISYYSLSSARLSERQVEPRKLHYSKGHWYLLAYCRLREQDCLFRLDRVREAVLTSESFLPRSKSMREPASTYEGDLFEADILLPEEEARYLGERELPYLKSVEYGLAKGMARIRVVSSSLPWIVSLVLKYGGRAVVERPDRVRQAVAEAAQEMLEKYRQ